MIKVQIALKNNRYNLRNQILFLINKVDKLLVNQENKKVQMYKIRNDKGKQPLKQKKFKKS